MGGASCNLNMSALLPRNKCDLVTIQHRCKDTDRMAITCYCLSSFSTIQCTYNYGSFQVLVNPSYILEAPMKTKQIANAFPGYCPLQSFTVISHPSCKGWVSTCFELTTEYNPSSPSPVHCTKTQLSVDQNGSR